MNIFLNIIAFVNIIILLFSVLENIYKRILDYKGYKTIDNFLSIYMKNLNLNNDKKSPLKLKQIKKEIGNNNTLKNIQIENNNVVIIKKYMQIYQTLFSVLFNDENISSILRIKNSNDDFLTVSAIQNSNLLQDNYIYETNKNIDLMYIFLNKYQLLIISNVDDFSQKKKFFLQNKILQMNTKALISIPINDKNNVIGCYTIYFSKPLDDKVEISKIENLINNLKIILSNLIIPFTDTNI